ncbi:MAG TPA: ribosome biogenesis factor YjgA [Nitrospirota bacterium]|nr:ribosome biogenesis factor YjgA [Nitrospirota bacterium]
MGPGRKKDLKKTANAEQEQGAPPARLSRTQKKKAALLLQDLGERLVKLTDEQLDQIGLPEDILKAVKLAKTIKKHGPLDRQMQYVGSLMRKYDPAPVQKFFDALDRGKTPANRKA